MNVEPSLADFRQAHERIEPFIHRTPVLTSVTINRMTGGEISFKCENLQKAGAFKDSWRLQCGSFLERTMKRSEGGHSLLGKPCGGFGSCGTVARHPRLRGDAGNRPSCQEACRGRLRSGNYLLQADSRSQGEGAGRSLSRGQELPLSTPTMTFA